MAAIQMPHGESFEENARRAETALKTAKAEGAALAVLPEYWFATFPPTPATPRDAMAAWSRDLGLVVAGNAVEGRTNFGLVFDSGKLVLEQAKIHPMPREVTNGIEGGPALRAAKVLGLTTGMLVCADILYPEAARVLSLQGAQLLLNPVMSPYREVDNTKAARDAIFITRAYDSGAFVVKAGGYRQPPNGIAGRSLVAAPWGIVARYQDDFKEEILVADLDLARLREFRAHQATFPARRPSAYDGLV